MGRQTHRRRISTPRILVAAILICTQLTGAAYAGETQPLILGGEEGVWMPKDKAGKLLRDVGVQIEVQKALAAQRQLNQALQDELRVLRESRNIWKELATKQDPWWKSPAAVGWYSFVLGSLVTVGLTLAIHAGASK